MTDVATLEQWMQDTEGENLEFKAAKNNFDFGELTRYCVALANERGDRSLGHFLSFVTRYNILHSSSSLNGPLELLGLASRGMRIGRAMSCPLAVPPEAAGRTDSEFL